MIKEEYVTFETAKLLQQLGCNVEAENYYTNDKIESFEDAAHNFYMLPAPSQSLAMRWLREVKNLTILFELFTPSEVVGLGINPGSYAVDIYDSAKGYHLFSVEETLPFDTYEEAAEAGIQAACEYLIEKGGKQ